MNVDLSSYGRHYFKGEVAKPYLQQQGLSATILETSEWTRDVATTDKVAAAVLTWARSNGASVFAHCFQPLASAGLV